MDAIVPLVRNLGAIQFEDFPPEAVLAAKNCILDTLASLVAGTNAPGCPEVVGQAVEWGGKPESTILNYGKKVPVFLAALANGTMARAVDFDDVFEPGTIHASASIVPTALAVSERQGKIDGKAFLTAVTLGIDLICRLGKTHRIPPGVSGMNVTFQYAAFACAGVAAKLMGLDEEKTINAMGLAYSQTSGNSQNLLEGTLAIRFCQGLAAQAGIYSAVFADKGITAAKEVLQGKFGYFPVYQRGEYDPRALLEDLGKRFEVTHITTKTYPCCMHTHAAIDALRNILDIHPLKAGDIEKIVVRVNQQGYNFVCIPKSKAYRPRTVPEAQFSLPYTVITAFLKGHVSLRDFSEEVIRNPEVQRLTSKVECAVDQELERTFPGRVSPAIVEIRSKEGKGYIEKVVDRRGSPANPVTLEEVEEKFRQCCGFAKIPISKKNIEKIIAGIKELDTWCDVGQIAKLL
jgi:2-methylcitrate dehydratase PrpD